MSWIEYQRALLADDVRNEAFDRALAACIKRGESSVIDIGSGTGFLSFLAEKHGARDVTAIEHNPALCDLAVEIAERNKVRDITFINANSAEILDLPPADLVVSETLGNFAYEENILEILRDAKRLLAPGGKMMPCMLEQYVAPVIAPAYHDELAVWDRVGFGLDFTPARALGFNNLYVRRFRAADLLDGGAGAVCWDRVDLMRGKFSSLRKGSASFVAARQTTVNGFAGWWRAELASDIWLSTSPLAPATHWEQIYFPIATPVVLDAGDSVAIAVTSDSREGNGCELQWKVTHSRNEKIIATQKGDLRKGG